MTRICTFRKCGIAVVVRSIQYVTVATEKYFEHFGVAELPGLLRTYPAQPISSANRFEYGCGSTTAAGVPRL